MNLHNVILLMGPPGSGKGTQSRLLVEKLGYGYFSMGDAFRDLSKQDTPLSREIKAIIDQGIIVPDEKTTQVFDEAIEKVSDKPGVIIDGFPRTHGQVEMLNRYLARHGNPHLKILVLDVDKGHLLDRLSKRSEIEGRADDADIAAIERRFDEYQAKTAVIKEFYEQQGMVTHINGDQTVEEVHKDILEQIS